MVLENFIVDAPIVWDRVGKKIFENPHVKQGRKMRVQITNAGMVEDLSGYTLALGWKHTVSGVDGLDVFEDNSEANVGIFEMAYTENLMTNLGNLKASLVLTSVEDMVVAESNDFYVKVDDSPFSADAEQGVGSYTRLAQILLNEEIRQEAYLRNEALVGSIDDKFDAFIQTNIVQEEVAEVFNNLEETYAQDLVSVKNGLEQKANKDEVTNVLTPKGNSLYASLPTVGNTIGDYYYCSDGNGTAGKGNYVWNGTVWYFGGTGDEGYSILKSELNSVDETFISQQIKVISPKVEYFGKATIAAIGLVTTSSFNDAYLVTLNGATAVTVDNANFLGFFSSKPVIGTTYTIDNTRQADVYNSVVTIPEGCLYLLASNVIGVSVSADIYPVKKTLAEKMDLTTGEYINENINVLPTSERSIVLNGVLCSYNNGILKLKGTATTFGGRITPIIKFELPPGIYSHRGLDTHGADYAVFLQNASTNAIIQNLKTSFKLNIESKTKVFIGCNFSIGTYYDLTIPLQLTKGEKYQEKWFAPNEISSKDSVARAYVDYATNAKKGLWSYAMENILVIGDSISAGGTFTQDWSPIATDSIAQNWPHIMGRMLNAKVDNGGFSGYTATTWYNNKSSLYDYKKYDTFIIWLGTNNALTDTLDVDVNPYSDYHDFALTETGYYCKIIEKILAEHGQTGVYDGCLIVLAKVFASVGDVAITNSVIDKIAEKYDLPVVDNSKLNDAKYPELRGGITNLHFCKAGNIFLANKFINDIGAWFDDDPTRCEYGWSPRL